ncbi:long-chain-fatty-acid--CoA ligase [Actinomadura sp. NBRC 104412]|uniref:AMP-binding protein n=1 Tax=Actinomadura sp. NBRC 104412 TaxID=3032203 RepID=UPI0024A26930|nr:AMP-binding protein [Actinomadura sp. NBRC 104412]GLZ06181.1 long-chain-fatty-acid--CoA ligase [Actinomadura sp. NBRC 104412]
MTGGGISGGGSGAGGSGVLARGRFDKYRQPERLRTAWRRAGLIDDSVVGERLIARLDQFPDRTAIVDGAVRVTNRGLRRRANALAAAFRDAGIGPGDVVAWQIPNWWEAAVVALATWQVGAVNNPIVMIYREHELRQILSELRPAAVVTPVRFRGHPHTALLDTVLDGLGTPQPRLRLAVRGTASGWTELGPLLERPAPDVRVPAVVTAEDPCVVAYTSGTTARAKGVVVDSVGLLAETRQMRETWGVSWRDVSFMPAPFAHLTGLIVGFTMPVTAGAPVVLQDVWDAGRAVRLIEEEGCTISSGTPIFLQEILAAYEAAGMTRSSLRGYSVGGAATDPGLIDRAERIGLHAWRCYGSTEHMSTTIANATTPIAVRRDTDGPVGPGSEVSVVDASGVPLGPGRDGLIRVRGPERMLGYVNEDDNAAALDPAEGWFVTGDVGRVDEDGNVVITGRVKDIVNRGGEKFSTREIEEAVLAHPGVLHVAVVPGPDERYGEVPVAFYVVRADSEPPGAEELVEFVRARGLARQKVPVAWFALDELPTTAFGKIRKQELVARIPRR